MSFAQGSNYKVGRYSGEGSINRPGNFFSCTFTDEDDNNFGLNNTPEVQCILGKVSKVISWVNATINGSWYFSHVDFMNNGQDKKEYITLLYNINRFWDNEYGGETLFYNSYGEKEIAVDFIPNQIVVFPSRLAHKPAFSDGNTEPRYMYSCQYVK